MMDNLALWREQLPPHVESESQKSPKRGFTFLRLHSVSESVSSFLRIYKAPPYLPPYLTRASKQWIPAIKLISELPYSCWTSLFVYPHFLLKAGLDQNVSLPLLFHTLKFQTQSLYFFHIFSPATFSTFRIFIPLRPLQNQKMYINQCIHLSIFSSSNYFVNSWSLPSLKKNPIN